MMTIGEFALNTGLSVKALRFYDERGVLTPATVDPHNGYRSYSARQLRDASTVRVLRAAGVGVDRVAQALAEPDLIDSVLADRRREVAEQRAREDRALALGARLGELREPAEVGTREAPATHWAAVVVEVDVTAADQVDDDAVDEGCEALGTALAAAGNPPVGIFWTAMRPGPTASSVTVLLTCPVARPADPAPIVAGWDVRTGTLPARIEAYVTQPLAGIGVEDLVDDDPGGRLPSPAFISLHERLEEIGVEAPEVRQVPVLGEGGEVAAMEAVVTLEER